MTARSVLTVNWKQDGEPMCYSTEDVAFVPRPGDPFRIMERAHTEERGHHRVTLVAGVVRTLAWIYSEPDGPTGTDWHNACVTLASHPTHETVNIDASCGQCGATLPLKELSFDRDGDDPQCVTCLPVTWHSKAAGTRQA